MTTLRLVQVTFQNSKQASTQLQLAPTLEFGTFSCPCTIEPASQVADAGTFDGFDGA